MRFWATIPFVLLVDQITKLWLASRMLPGDSIPLVDEFISLTYVLNRGAAFGMLQGKSWLFLTMAGIISLALVYYNLKFTSPRWLQYAMGLIVGGTLGNVVDRWYFGAVRDFFSVGWWPVFNVADMAIVIGGCLVVLYLMTHDLDSEQA